MDQAPFSNNELQAAAQMRYGVPLTCLMSSVDLPLKSNASAPDKFVDAFGRNIKNLWGQRAEARRQTTTRS